MSKKYATLNTLQKFLVKLKSLFATKIEVENAVAQKSQVKIIASEGTQTLPTLQIHKLTQEEYDQKVDNGEIDKTAIYLTPDEEIDLSKYATIESLEGLEQTMNTKVKLFHATLDPATTQYIKDSGDFTYADVAATENCKIEATFGNVKIILNKEMHRNIEPDPVAGRYVEFSALLRNGLTTVKVFLFVYDPESLPTDAQSVEILKDWGDSQYCGIAVQHIVIGDFLDNDIEAGKNNAINAPSTKAIRDYVVANFEQQANKIQNIFDYSTDETKYPSTKATYDLMKFVYDLVMPVVIYDNPTGFEANDEDVGSWSLTGLDLTPYKRVKFYIKAAESGSTGSPSHIVELHLDDRAKNSQGHFTGGHTSIFPDAEGKFHNVVCSVSGDKTAVAFNKAYRYSASTAATSSGGRYCYLIEGYYI
jgi:hypothetical protein